MKLPKLVSLEMLSFSLLLGLVASIGSLIFFAWLSEEVLEGSTRPFDEVTRTQVHRLAFPALTSSMIGISFVGSTLFLLIATAAFVIWFALMRWRRDAILFTVTMVGAAILNTTLKLAFHRPRPNPYFDLRAPSSFSFPSGHALASFCFYLGLAAILTTRVERRNMRVLLWVLASFCVLLIGLSRIYLGVHFTTDVIAGYCAALIWVIFVRFAQVQLARSRKKKQNPEVAVR